MDIEAVRPGARSRASPRAPTTSSSAARPCSRHATTPRPRSSSSAPIALEPGKGSILEALGRAYYNSGQPSGRARRSRSCSRSTRRPTTASTRSARASSGSGGARRRPDPPPAGGRAEPGHDAVPRCARAARLGTGRADASGTGRRAEGSGARRPLGLAQARQPEQPDERLPVAVLARARRPPARRATGPARGAGARPRRVRGGRRRPAAGPWRGTGASARTRSRAR